MRNYELSPNLNLKINKNRESEKYKIILYVLIFISLAFLFFELEVTFIVELDISNSLHRNYWHELAKGLIPSSMSYEEFLIRCYKENITESLITASLLWVAIVFLIDLTEDFLRFFNKKISFKKKVRLNFQESSNILKVSLD